MKISLQIYKYNRENLEFSRIVLKLKDILRLLGVQILISVVLIALMSLVFNTPKENKLKSEITSLKHEFYILDKQTDDLIKHLKLIEVKDSAIYQSLFQTNPYNSIFKSEHLTGGDGTFYDTITKIGNKINKVESSMESINYRFRKLLSEIDKNEDRLMHTPAIMPISNRDLRRTSSGFGYRIHPIYKVKKMHNGMDFVAPIGTPVYATADGVVSISSKSFHGYGMYVRINHGYDYQTCYAHMNSLRVKKGQKVKRGDIVGTLGNTGLSTGPHLHYEIIRNGKFVDPINFYYHDLNAHEYEEMLIISRSIEKSLD